MSRPQFGVGDVSALLNVARHDPSNDARCSAFRALTRLPLGSEAWAVVSKIGRDAVRDRAAGEVRRVAIENAIRVPVIEMREVLRQVARDPEDPDRSVAAKSLARAKDPAALPGLIESVRAGDRHAAALLAGMPIERLDGAVAEVRALAAEDLGPIVGFFLRLALARIGDRASLDDAFASLDAGDVPIFWGDPEEDAAEIALVLPVPASIADAARKVLADDTRSAVAHVVAGVLARSDAAVEKNVPSEDAHAPMPAAGAVRRMLGRLREDPVTTIQTFSEDDFDCLRVTPLRSARPVLTRAVVKVLEMSSADPESSAQIYMGNGLIRLADAMPRGASPRVRDIVRTLARHERAVGPAHASTSLREQVGYVVSRAGAESLIADATPFLQRRETAVRESAARIVETAARYLDASYGPIFGGAPVSDDPAPPTELLISEHENMPTTGDRHAARAPHPREDDREVAVEMKLDPEHGSKPEMGMAEIELAAIVETLAPGAGVSDRAPAAAAEPSAPPHSRTSYARLDAPGAVAVEVEFPLATGIAERPVAGVVGGSFALPPVAADPYVVTVHVLHDGFRLRDGESARQDLVVSAADPWPSVTLHLTAIRDDAKLSPLRWIQAIYLLGGQVVGAGVRAIVVVGDAAAAPVGAPPPGGVGISIPTHTRPPPDITITIAKGASVTGGGLQWSLETPWKIAGLPAPGDPSLLSDIGSDPLAFARALIRQVNVREGKPGLWQYLVGTGRSITKLIPDPVVRALHDVAAAVRAAGRTDPPTVLLLSQEPYVPWELARIVPPIAGGTSPFLAAQVTIGHWVLGHGSPPLPPPEGQHVRDVAVVKGVYQNVPGWRRLVEAEGEADDLRAAYAAPFTAKEVAATMPEVLRCLEDGDPPGDVLHFAMHGSFDPNGAQNGLVLTDQQALDPMVVRGTDLERHPFVFLNACQVGMGQEILGDYAGMAAAFLDAGASAVVAPLWSVQDTVARTVATGFYAKARGGERPAEFLRAARASLPATQGPMSATHLAYQFFGHPHYTLNHV